MSEGYWYAYECYNSECNGQVVLDVRVTGPLRFEGTVLKVSCPVCSVSMEYDSCCVADFQGYGSRACPNASGEK